MAIQQCELVLVHIYPQGEDTLVSDRPKKEVGANKKLRAQLSECNENHSGHYKQIVSEPKGGLIHKITVMWKFDNFDLCF